MALRALLLEPDEKLVGGVEQPLVRRSVRVVLLAILERELTTDHGAFLVDAAQSGVGQVLAAALGWARRTRGAFDPTTATLLDLWDILAGPHPIVPLMIRNTRKTAALVEHLFTHNILVTGLNFPVVPKGDEEIRFQNSASHTEQDIDYALNVLADFAKLDR